MKTDPAEIKRPTTLRDNHPIFAGSLKRTIRKLFVSNEEFCELVEITPEHLDDMLITDSASMDLPALVRILKVIHYRSSMAYKGLCHDLMDDIEETVEQSFDPSEPEEEDEDE